MATKILVVGGTQTFISGGFEAHLNEVGLEIAKHIPAKSVGPVEHIPASCKGVLVIIVGCGHIQSQTAIELAKKANIPHVLCGHAWSKAWPIIQEKFGPAGLLTLPEEGVPDIEVTPSDILNSATEFIRDIREQRGHPPKQDEVLGALRREFGSDVELPKSLYIQAANAAAYTEEAVTRKDKQDQKQDIRDTIVMCLQDNPGRVLDPNGVQQTVLEL